MPRADPALSLALLREVGQWTERPASLRRRNPGDVLVLTWSSGRTLALDAARLRSIPVGGENY